jgi:hypothetical protein
LFWLQNISPNLDHPTSPTYYIYIYIVKEEEEKILKKKKEKNQGVDQPPPNNSNHRKFQKENFNFFFKYIQFKKFS